jgi:DNA-binding response OmpR family regulator
VASTLLAVDDSVTMRKVLEITFAGPDFKVVTANSPDAALQKLKSDKVDLVIADISLEPQNGYDLCKAIKKASPATPVLLLSSKQNAYDAAKGSAAQADEHMDKPFDTQQMIDKVKKLLAAGPSVAAAAPAAKPAEKAPAAAAQTTPSMQAPVAAQALKQAPAAQPQPAPAAAAPVQRAKTLIYNPPAAGAAAPAGAPVAQRAPAGPTPVSGLPMQAKTLALEAKEPTPAPAPVAPAPSLAAAPVATLVNGQLQGKLEQIGLTPAQVEAVTALSREVIERVVWEVVPVLAETIIKEEISRLTK